ncbi:MAG: hypothetical protein AB3N11_14025 [Arenibacterium sp.]
MKFVKILLSVLAVTLLPVSASAVTYDCELKAESRLGWIPPRLIILIGQDEARAIVYDGFIHKKYGEPIPARLERVNKNKFRLTWTVEHMEIANRTNTISGDFIANLNTATNKITMKTYL